MFDANDMGNSYFNDSVDFYLEKPEDWVFIPTQWAVNIRNRAAHSDEEIASIMQQANLPFVYMQKPLIRNDIAHPTVQATCRYFKKPTSEEMERLARLQLQVLESSFNNFELIHFSTSAIISGCPANYYKASFSILNESGDSFDCLSQSWTVFYNNMGYTVGASGSADNIDVYQSDLDEIVNSILIGKSHGKLL